MEKDTDTCICKHAQTRMSETYTFWEFDCLEQKMLGGVFLKYSIFQHSRCGKKKAAADSGLCRVMA